MDFTIKKQVEIAITNFIYQMENTIKHKFTPILMDSPITIYSLFKMDNSIIITSHFKWRIPFKFVVDFPIKSFGANFTENGCVEGWCNVCRLKVTFLKKRTSTC